MGISIPIDASRRPTPRDLCFQRGDWGPGNYRKDEGIFPALPPEMDNGGFSLHQGAGLYPGQKAGSDKEASSARARPIGQSSSQAEVSKVEGRRRSSRFFESRRSVRPSMEGSHSHGGAGSEMEEDASVYGELGVGVTMKPMSLHAWSCSITRCLLRSRTPFSRFLRRALDGCNGGHLDVTATALFPIPLPLHGRWLFGPQRLGKARRFRAAIHRVVHFVVLAMNYLHCGDGFDLELLRRSPSQAHLVVYQRMEALIRAGGPPDVISIVGCGRKSFQLGARLKELVGCLQSLGLNEKSAYHCGGGAVPVPQCNDREELVPYRPLDAARLKLSGKGHWECSQFIDPLFYMPFVEPRVNQYDLAPDFDNLPNFQQIDKAEVLKLCKVWDVQGLLRIYPLENGPKKSFAYTKIFNNYKSVEKDRQIGDRRGANSQEGKLRGASTTLPTGVCLLSLCPRRHVEQLRASVCDRRDFYHQFAVSDQKASLNALYPPMKLSDLLHLKAAEAFQETFIKKKKKRWNREAMGDMLHTNGPRRPLLCPDDPDVVACFGAILQGDHLGVEIATCSHAGLLQSMGMLQQWSRLESHVPIVDDAYVDGLVIDDVFTISKEAVKLATSDFESESYLRLMDAKRIYAKHSLAGSDDKDVLGACDFKVCGIEVLSNAKTLVGSWISMALMRRQMMSIFDEVFKVIPSGQLDTERPVLRRMSNRSAAAEFQLLAALAPVMVSNLSVPFEDRVFATDASNEKGGITVAHGGQAIVAAGWRTADKKGKNLPLLRPAQALLASHDILFEEDASGGFHANEDADREEACPRPLGLRYQFIEICGGAGAVTKALIALGIVCGPVFDLAISSQYDLGNLLALRWLIHLLESGRLESFLVSPPCTTFSAAAFPALRGYAQAEGYDLTNERTLLGNLLAYHSLCLLFVALRVGTFGLGEQPRRSKMRWLKAWRRLRSVGLKEAFLASCSFGSIHQKEFCFAGVNMHVELLHRPCTRDHSHVPIQGKFTKPSATYVPKLAETLAIFFKDHLVALQRERERLDFEAEGLEDQL